jgi:peptidylprolyl isomerase
MGAVPKSCDSGVLGMAQQGYLKAERRIWSRPRAAALVMVIGLMSLILTSPAQGYVDPRTGKERTVPLEIRIPGDPAPVYNQTFEDLGRYKAEAILPFATYGTLGWAHSDERLDDGSSQFFFFLYEPELTPAGLNLVDGRNAAFGYVVDGFEVLEELGVDDAIVTITVQEGAENLRAHG